MSEHITELQNKIDETKQKLAAIDDYATLSGLSILPRNWVIEPYLYSSATGIIPQVNEENEVTSFNIEHTLRVKKHYIDEKPCRSECTVALSTCSEVPSGNWKPLSEFSESEKTAIIEQNKIDCQVEMRAIKRAELDFLNGTLDYILRKD